MQIAIAVGGIGLIGWLDYLTGYQLRMFPLYFAPVGYASATGGRAPGVSLALVSAVTWYVCDRLTGADSGGWLLGTNALLHFGACAWIAILIARLRSLHQLERTNARTDALTGLPNRRALLERMALEHARLGRGAGPLAVACMDLDRFKELNDRDGHAAGDRVLREIGLLFHETLRGCDLAARTGGDEFVLVLPDTSRDEAQRALERVCRAVAARWSAATSVMTASLGAVVCTNGTHDPDRCLRDADRALYEAKRGGRNRVCVSELDPVKGTAIDSPTGRRA